jgi:hypothetical protein
MQYELDALAKLREGGTEIPPIEPRLQGILREIATWNPKWCYYFRIRERLQEVYITAGEETIGRIYSYNGNELYEYDTPALSNVRSRGQANATKKRDVLLKNLKKHMDSPSYGALLAGVKNEGVSIVKNAVGSGVREFNNSKDKLWHKISVAVINEWATISKIVPVSAEDYQVGVDLNRSLSQYLKDTALLVSASDCTQAVILDNDQFIYYPSKDTEPVVVSRGNAPEYMREAVGILKLTPLGEYIEDFGVRITETKFLIVKKDT